MEETFSYKSCPVYTFTIKKGPVIHSIILPLFLGKKIKFRNKLVCVEAYLLNNVFKR